MRLSSDDYLGSSADISVDITCSTNDIWWSCEDHLSITGIVPSDYFMTICWLYGLSWPCGDQQKIIWTLSDELLFKIWLSCVEYLIIIWLISDDHLLIIWYFQKNQYYCLMLVWCDYHLKIIWLYSDDNLWVICR